MRKRCTLAQRELGTRQGPKEQGPKISRARSSRAGSLSQNRFFVAPPSPPVWHTSVFDFEGVRGGTHTFSIPRPYRMHTSHTLSADFRRDSCMAYGLGGFNHGTIMRGARK